jgi:hypothetical protein
VAGQQHLEAGACVSVLLHPLRAGPAPLRLREIGLVENIDMSVSSSCGTNASTCACCLPPLRHPPRTRSSPGRSVRTRASRGPSGSLAMRARKLLGKSRSRCLASQRALPPHSVSRRRNFAFPTDRLPLLEQAGLSERSLLVSFPGWVSLLPLFCLVCSPSNQFGWIFRTSLPGSV